MFSSVASVTISVHDVNNNHPVFGRESYVVSVQEDAAVGKNFLYKYNPSHFLVNYINFNTCVCVRACVRVPAHMHARACACVGGGDSFMEF
jgi:hypothetical protein